jgi:hypothetical protein
MFQSIHSFRDIYVHFSPQITAFLNENNIVL